ncbi:hypothetical protein ACHQM5_014187 [Ranunculus cassubicifolius]
MAAPLLHSASPIFLYFISLHLPPWPWKRSQTTLEMLRDRGYEVPNSDINLSLQQFRDRFGQNPSLDQLRISLPLRSDHTKRILVIFCSTDVLKLNAVKNIFTQIGSSQDLTALVLILQSKMTPQAKQALKNCRVKAEYFQDTVLKRWLRCLIRQVEKESTDDLY